MKTSNGMGRLLGALGLAAALVGATGCKDDNGPEEPSGLRGELDAGTFFYGCDGEADAQCDADAVVSAADAVTGAFPPIASGATFKIGYTEDEGSFNAQHFIRTGSQAFITGEDEIFTTHRAGIVALVVTAASGSPIDLVHVNVAEVAGLRISQATTTEETIEDIEAGANIDIDGSDVEIDVGGSVTVTTRTFLRAAPVDANDRVLAGSLPTSWTSSDTSVIDVVSSANNNVVEIEAGVAGSATLTVTMGAFEADVTIEVGS